jgi:hypothetical protein
MLLQLQVPKVVKKAGWALRSVLKGTKQLLFMLFAARAQQGGRRVTQCIGTSDVGVRDGPVV